MKNNRAISEIIKVKGRIDASNFSEYREKLLSELPANSNVILDLESLDFIDSSGLGVFVRLHKVLKQRDLELRLVNLNHKIRLVFEITRANKMFKIFDDLDSAIRSVA